MDIKLNLCEWHEKCKCDSSLLFESQPFVQQHILDVLAESTSAVHLRQFSIDAGLCEQLQQCDDHHIVEHLVLHIESNKFHLCGSIQTAPVLRYAPAPLASNNSALTPSQLRGRPVRDVAHWVEFKIFDRIGKAIGGIPYNLEAPSGGIENGKLPASGRVRRDSCEVGAYTLNIGELVDATWRVAGMRVDGQLPASSDLTLAVKTHSLDPGTVGNFEVFHLFDEEPGRSIASTTGTLGADGCITATFNFEPPNGIGRYSELIFSCAVGQLWIKSYPLILLHPRLLQPHWSKIIAWVGDEVEVSVSCPGIKNSTPIQFAIHRADTHAVYVTLDSIVEGKLASASWKAVDPDPNTGESDLYFVAHCNGLEAQSATLTLNDRVEYEFVDDTGLPLSFLPVSLEYRDGTRRVLTTDADGMVRLTDPRAMNARIIVYGVDEADVTIIEDIPL